jgi:hypothetical protein
MRMRVNDVAQLRQAVFGVAGGMKVQADPDTGISAKTVDELRTLTSCPAGLVVIVERERYPETTVTIIKSSD